MISERISDDTPPQMEILNMVIPILMHFCSFVSSWSEIIGGILRYFLVFYKIESWDYNLCYHYMLSFDPLLYFVSSRSDLGIYIHYFLNKIGIL